MFLLGSFNSNQTFTFQIHQKEGVFPGHVPHPNELPLEPEIIEVVFEKVKGSIGLSIVAAKVNILFYIFLRRIKTNV